MYHRRLLLVLFADSEYSNTQQRAEKRTQREYKNNSREEKAKICKYTRGLDHRHKSVQERVFRWISLTSLYAHSRVAGGSATKNAVCCVQLEHAWSTKKLERSQQLWDERSHRSTFCCRAEPRDQQISIHNLPAPKKIPPRTPMAAAFISIHSCKCRSFHLISCIKSNHQDASFHLNLFSYRRKKKI